MTPAPPRVLVARLDNDGDVLLAGPAVRAAAASGKEVVLVHGPRGRAAAELLPGVARRLELHAPWIDPEPLPVDRAVLEDFADAVREADVDEAAILVSFHQTALPLALVLRQAGVETIAAVSPDYPGSLLDARLPYDAAQHEVERNLDVLAALGHELPPDDDGRLAVDLGAPTDAVPEVDVVVHPGASVPARAPSPDFARTLVAWLTINGWRVAVTGAPSERALTRHVAGTTGLDLGGRTSLRALGHLLTQTRLVVTGNTGPAHLAAAVGTPVLELFAPTVSPVNWAPWKTPHRLLYQDVPCAGCRAQNCPVAGHPCLTGVSVDAVVQAAAEMLAAPLVTV